MFEITSPAPEEQESIRRLQRLCPYPEVGITGELVRFVAKTDQLLVGYGCLELLPDNIALLRTLVVLPGYRKRSIGRQLLLRLISSGIERNVRDIYAPGLYAEDYFSRFHFSPCPPENLPAGILNHPFPGLEKLTGRLLGRSLQQEEAITASPVVSSAQEYFDQGLFCAESVLAAVADHLGVKSPLIPGIATGFCNGMAGTWGTCGSISGGVLAINIALGRQEGKASVDKNYQAVKHLIHEFQCRHGSTQCSELIACDLDTKDGRKVYRNNGLRSQCREYVGTAANISLGIIQEIKMAQASSPTPCDKNI